jgi:predicted short-subunit dehydrogenase-like oxidoreductase (DUF2520 family)
MRVVILGSGNVATILGQKIFVAGHDIVQVFSRNIDAVEKLASLVQAQAVNSPDAIDASAELYIIAVNDGAIAEIASWLRPAGGIVVHTAGSVPIEVLRQAGAKFGVLYPLQTLRKETNSAAEIPLLVDGSDAETTELIFTFAKSLSGTVQAADDAKRLKLHIAAVIMNNFSNHLFTLAYDYCKKENLDFRLLIPLITETADRLKLKPPAQLQTGPAARNDMSTIRHHLDQLKNYPDLAELYKMFTEKILDYHHDSD